MFHSILTCIAAYSCPSWRAYAGISVHLVTACSVIQAGVTQAFIIFLIKVGKNIFSGCISRMNNLCCRVIWFFFKQIIVYRLSTFIYRLFRWYIKWLRVKWVFRWFIIVFPFLIHDSCIRKIYDRCMTILNLTQSYWNCRIIRHPFA